MPQAKLPAAPFDATPLGEAVNFYKALPGAYIDTAKDIGQGLARDTLGLGRTIANTEGKALDYVTKQNNPQVYADSYTLPKALQPIFGSDPVKTLPGQYQDTKTAIQNSPIAQKLGLDKASGPLAFGAVLGQNILDFAPLGGSEDAAIKALAKETDPEVIGAMLRKIGVHPTIADKMAPHIAATSDPAEIKTALNTMKGAQAMHNESVHNESLKEPEVPSEQIPHPEAPELTPKAAQATAKEPYVINAKGKNLTDIRNIISDVKGYADPETHDRIEIKNVGKTGETHTIHLEAPEVTPEVRKMDIVRTPEESTSRKPPENLPKTLKNLASVAKKYPDSESFSRDLYRYNEATQRAKRLGFDDLKTYYVDPEQAGSLKPALYDVLAGENISYLMDKKTPGQVYNELISDSNIPEEIRSNPIQNPTPEVDTVHATHAEQQSKYIDSLSKEKVDGKPIDLTPAHTLAELTTKGPDAGSWESLVKGYSRNTTGMKKVNALDYLATPEFVLEKLGLQKGAELLQDAKDTYRKTLKTELKTVIDWKKRVESDPAAKPHSSTRIFRYLNGDARYAKGEMTPTEIEVAGEIKTYLKGWADRLHLPEDNRLGNYITHIFDKDATGPLPSESAFNDPDLAVIMESTPAKSVYNPFLEKRLNAPGYKEDVWGALDAYVKRGSRKEAMDPALEAISDMAHKLGPEEYEYATQLTHRINMRPTKMDVLVDNLVKEYAGNKLTQRPTAYVTGKIRMMFNRGLIGLNPASALRNLSQGANSYAKLGEIHTTKGYIQIFKKIITRDTSELVDEGVLDEGLIQDKKVGVYKTILQKADPVLYSMFQTAETINRGAAYYGGKSLYYEKNTHILDGQQVFKQGASEEEARKFGKRIVRETQFAFGQVDSPVLLSSDIVKTLTQLGGYSIKQVEFLGRMAKNKEWGGLARWSLSSLFFVYTIGRAFGMKPEQLIPVIGMNAPIFSVAEGVSGFLTGNTPQARAQAGTQLGNILTATIPAGSQIKKTFQGIQAYNAGKDVTATGKTRYTIPHNLPTFMQAAMFGKSALPQAQTYYNKLDHPTKKKPVATSGASTLSI